jgi:hypothetical protein
LRVARLLGGLLAHERNVPQTLERRKIRSTLADRHDDASGFDFTAGVRLGVDREKSMRGTPWLLAMLVAGWVGTARAQVVSVTPASCLRRDALDAAEYQRRWRFLALGDGYRMWADKDCYPPRLDDAALAKTARPIGYIVGIGSRDVFVVDFDPLWFSHCKKTPAPVTGALTVDGGTLLALVQHLASMPEFASLDLREIGFAEAAMRDKRVLFALHLGTADRVAHLECFEDLDAAVARAAEELMRSGSPAARAARP